MFVAGKHAVEWDGVPQPHVEITAKVLELASGTPIYFVNSQNVFYRSDKTGLKLKFVVPAGAQGWPGTTYVRSSDGTGTWEREKLEDNKQDFRNY